MRGDHKDIGSENAEAKATAGRSFPVATIADESRGGLRQCAPRRPLSAMLDGKIYILVTGIHDHTTA